MANKIVFRNRQDEKYYQTDYQIDFRTDNLNEAGGRAYAFEPEHALAQYAATGCLNDTFYATAEMQLETVLRLCERCDQEFIARTALYSRQKGFMKDMPALLCAVLSVRNAKLLEQIFDRVIDDAKMIRNFVQIMRSGVVGRKSLGSLPKRLVRNWIERQSVERLFTASVGNDPSLVDIVRMVHPKPGTEERKAFFDYLLGKEYDAEKLPKIVKEYESYKNMLKRGETPDQLPKVPFQMLTSEPLTPYEWIQIAQNASWQTTRMNLNTFARNGVFGEAEDRLEVEKKFPPIDPWEVWHELVEPKKPKRDGYIPRQSIFVGCDNSMVKEIVRQQEEIEQKKEEEAWQNRWQDYLRAHKEFEEKSQDIDAEVVRLKAARQERIAQYIDNQKQIRVNILKREENQKNLLEKARPEIVRLIADRLRDKEAIARSRMFPYQLMTAYMNAENIPNEIREALQEAMEIATANVPAVAGKVYVFPDLSGSMQDSATGYRKGATSKVRCIDIAALVASAMLRKNPSSEIIPFGTDIVLIDLDSEDSIMTNAAKLASIDGGGTNCSAPLRYLNEKEAEGDLISYVSDNQSWIDGGCDWGEQTETVRQWNAFKKRSPSARMICIDIQPYRTTQAKERDDIINIGGFSDHVFSLIAEIASGAGMGHWVRSIEEMPLA